MKMFIFALIMISMLAVFATMLIGLVRMSKDGKENRTKSNNMMWMRVYLQGIAIALMFLFAALS